MLFRSIVGAQHTFVVHAYKGIGRIPKGMKDPKDASRRILLENLPKLLKGYGRTFAGHPPGFRAAVIVVCDLDDQCRKTFREQLIAIRDACQPRPETRFCIAIEEGEAWFLGDLDAVRKAFPRAKADVLASYVNDSICGTWETLADAVFPGGAKALSARGWRAVGAEKSRWAETIAPLMDVEANASPSYCYWRGKLRGLAGGG